MSPNVPQCPKSSINLLEVLLELPTLKPLNPGKGFFRGLCELYVLHEGYCKPALALPSSYSLSAHVLAVYVEVDLNVIT